MNTAWATRFERWEALRRQCAETLLEFSPQAHHRPSAPGKWSAVQVVTHIYDAERNALLYVRKKLQAGDQLEPSGIRGAFRFAVLRLALVSPLKFKAPGIIASPDNTRDASQLLEEWSLLRMEWRELLEQIPAAYHNRALFKHPVAGKIGMRHALAFMTDHLERHLRQLQGFPKA